MTARTLPAAGIHVGDVVLIDGRVVTITHTSNADPTPGHVLLTDTAGRAWGMGAAAPVQIVGLS